MRATYAERKALRDLKDKEKTLSRYTDIADQFLSAMPLERREQLLGAGFREVEKMNDMEFGEFRSRLKYMLAE
jgi:hypothetical protein